MGSCLSVSYSLRFRKIKYWILLHSFRTAGKHASHPMITETKCLSCNYLWERIDSGTAIVISNTKAGVALRLGRKCLEWPNQSLLLISSVPSSVTQH